MADLGGFQRFPLKLPFAATVYNWDERERAPTLMMAMALCQSFRLSDHVRPPFAHALNHVIFLNL